MGKSRDRATRSGSDPVNIGTSRLSVDSGNIKVTAQDGTTFKKIFAEEVQVGSGNNRVIFKRGSDGKAQFQSTTDGGSSTSNLQVGGSGTVTNPSDLPITGNTAGDTVLVTSTNNLMIYNGSGWYKIATITNASPTISSAGNSTYAFATDGTPVTIEIVASDPEGIALQYKYQVTTGSLGSTATVTNSATSGGTYSALAANTLSNNRFFKVTPSTNTAHTGTFAITFSVTDGVNTANSSASSFTLAFDVSGSFVFDGTGDYITIPSSSDFNFGTGDFSIEFYVNPTNFTNRGTFLDTRPSSGTTGITIGHEASSGEIRVYMNASSGSDIAVQSTGLVTGEWQHIAVTRASGTVKLYIDGVEKDSGTAADDMNNTNAVNIGYRTNTSSSYNYYTGYMSNVRVVKGSTVYTPSNVFAGSTSFDGNGDYLLTATNSNLVIGSNDFTAECWIYTTSFSNVQGVIDRRRSGDAANYDWTTYLNTDNTLNFYASGGTRITSSALTTNTWYHTAVVKNSGTTTLYVDGVSQGTWGDSATYPSNQITVGAYGPSLSSLWYSGYISNLRIVIGTAVYTSNFTRPSSPLTAITNTELLTCQNSTGTITDASSNNISITANGNAAASTQVLTSFTVPTSGLSAVTNTKLLTLTEKEPSRITNGSYFFSSGNGIGGSNARVITANDNNMQLGTSTDFTFECWYKLNSYPTSVDAYLWDFGDGQWGWLVPYIMRNGYLRVGTYHGTIFAGSTSDGGAELNRWYHLAITREGSTFKVYLDGTLLGSNTQSSWGLSPNNARISLGGYANLSYLNYGVKSYISDFRFVKGLAVYTGNFSVPTGPLTKTGGTYPNNTNRTDPTASQTLLLTANHSSGTPVDSSDSNRSLTVYATVEVGNGVENAPADQSSSSHSLSFAGDTTHSYVSPFVQGSGGSVLFDGTNDNLSIPSFAMGTSNYTIEMWFNATSLGNYVHLYDGRGGSSGDAILIQLTNTGTVRFYSVSFRITGSTQASANTWNHVALERVGNVNTLYLNGVSQGTYDDGGTSFVGPSNNVGRIGSDDSGSGSFFPGYISNFRIVKGSAVYNGNFTVPTSALTAITNTQILTCQNSTGSITDASSNNHTVTANGGAIATRYNPF